MTAVTVESFDTTAVAQDTQDAQDEQEQQPRHAAPGTGKWFGRGGRHRAAEDSAPKS